LLPNLLYSGLDTFVQGLTWRRARVPYAPLSAEVLQIGDVTATLSGKVVLPGGLGQMGLGGAGSSTTLGVSHVAVDPKEAKWAAHARTAVTVSSGGSAFDISDVDLNVDERGNGQVTIALNLAAHMISGFTGRVGELLKHAPGVRLAITVALKGYVPQPPTFLTHGIEVLEWLAEPILQGLEAAALAAQQGLAFTLKGVEKVTDEAVALAKSAVSELEAMRISAQERLAGLRRRALELEAEMAAKSAAVAHKAVAETAHAAGKAVAKTAAGAAAAEHALVNMAQRFAKHGKHARKAVGVLAAFRAC
jgi:hypothetical protein